MSKVPIRIIAGLQIIGGLFSMVFIVWALVTQIRNIFAFGIGIGEIFVDIFSVVAGIALWCGTSFGRKASMAVQAIQLPKIISPALIFMFSFGFDFWLHSSSSAFGFQTAFFGNNQVFIGVGVQDVPVDLGVSVTAIIALVILKKYKPTVRTSLRPSPPLPPSEWPASSEAAPNKSLDASGGSVFRIMTDPAMLE
jgi:hypothetical protein